MIIIILRAHVLIIVEITCIAINILQLSWIYLFTEYIREI